MLPQGWRLASSSLVPHDVTVVAFHFWFPCHILGASSSGGGLFGRPAILRSGALLICGEVVTNSSAGTPQIVQVTTHCHCPRHYLPDSPAKGKNGNSSLLPEARLR
jgi:hypothetical protein